MFEPFRGHRAVTGRLGWVEGDSVRSSWEHVFVSGGRRELNWSAIRDYYDAGHTKGESMARFGFSDWDWHAAVGRGDVRPRTKGELVRSSRRRALIARLREQGLSYGVISKRLGVSKATVAYHARRRGVPARDECARRYDWTEIQGAVDSGLSKRQCMQRFGFSSDAWHQAVLRGDLLPPPRAMPIERLLVVGRRTNRSHLKTRLLQEGVKENCCEECGLTEWRDKPVSMQLHHVNGVGNDNRLENVVFLCPNCHSQTDTYGGRNGHRRVTARAATSE